jgi:flagellar basal body-associated protein FliL
MAEAKADKKDKPRTTSGRKMFIFILLTTLFFLVTIGYMGAMVWTKNPIHYAVPLVFMGAEFLLSSLVLSLNSIEKIKLTASSLGDVVKQVTGKGD